MIGINDYIRGQIHVVIDMRLISNISASCYQLFTNRGGYLFIFTFILSLCSCVTNRRAVISDIGENESHRSLSRLTTNLIDSLECYYGSTKVLLHEYKEPILIALSYYPELKETPIEFKYSREATTMAARPIYSSLLYGKRSYQVLINNDPDFKGIPLSAVPFNAQVGVIGHELAHIVEYENRSLWGVMELGCRYLNKHFKPHFERSTDKETIVRGLGWQLYDWAKYSMYDNPYATEEYKQFKRKTYMRPEEIKSYIHTLSTYAPYRK